MSPECIQGGGYEFKSDLWSLGCLLYELATLRSPFYVPGTNFYILGKKIMARQFEPMAGCSPPLTQLVDTMLQVSHAPGDGGRTQHCAPLASAPSPSLFSLPLLLPLFSSLSAATGRALRPPISL